MRLSMAKARENAMKRSLSESGGGESSSSTVEQNRNNSETENVWTGNNPENMRKGLLVHSV